MRELIRDHPATALARGEWFDRVDAISETDWLKIARANAEKLLNLLWLRPRVEFFV